MQIAASRQPLVAQSLRTRLLGPTSWWTAVEWTAETGSTNADAVAAAQAGAAEGLVVVTERQTAGRGRLGRVWESPPGAGLAVSVVLRPTVPVAAFGWLPLLAGVALAGAVARETGVPARLKWPNDLLIDDRKCAGILAEGVPTRPGGGQPTAGAVVVGIGLNVTLTQDELPRPDATSLALAGATNLDREALLVAVLGELAGWYQRWVETGGDADACGLRARYRVMCGSLGREVRVELPGRASRTGTATDIDHEGRLVVAGSPVAAGDVVHVR